MAAVQLIELQRNETITLAFALTDSAGQALDLTGATFEMDVKKAAGAPGAPIASASVAIEDAAGGVIHVTLDGSDFGAVAGEQENVQLAYDLIMTLDAIPRAVMRGSLVLVPGVTA